MDVNDLKDAHKGATVWVLGNAPSLTDEVVQRAEQDVLIVCNYFSWHPRWPDIAVDYYTWTEPRGGAITADLHYIAEVQGTGPCTWLVHESVAHAPSIPMRFFGTPTGSWPSLDQLVTDLNEPLIGNTTVVAILGIPLALWVGAARIVIAGVELTASGHFYPGIGGTDSASPGGAWVDECNYRFGLWAELCASRGVELINVTPTGNLTLPRVDWRTL